MGDEEESGSNKQVGGDSNKLSRNICLTLIGALACLIRPSMANYVSSHEFEWAGIEAAMMGPQNPAQDSDR